MKILTTFLGFLLITNLYVFSENNLSKNSSHRTFSNQQGDEYKVITLTQEEFIEQIFDYKTNKEWKFKGNKPVIIDFYAEWCAPCKKLAPILSEIQNEYKEKIQIYKVDAEKNRELAAIFGVTAYPTVIFISTTKQPAQIKGLYPKEELERIIEEYLNVSKY